jgi:hypothetical protein
MTNFILTTPEEMECIIEKCLSRYHPQIQSIVTETPRHLHSLQELADFIGCSVVTAHKLKKSGRIRCTQYGRKLIFNSDEVIEDLKKKKKI